jgi:hypothetical protein
LVVKNPDCEATIALITFALMKTTELKTDFGISEMLDALCITSINKGACTGNQMA